MRCPNCQSSPSSQLRYCESCGIELAMGEKGDWTPDIGVSSKNETFFERLAKFTREFVFVVDVTKMRYRYVSESAIQFLGCTRDQLTGTDGIDIVLDRVHPPDRSEFMSRFENLVQSSCKPSDLLDDREFTEFHYRQLDASGRLHRLNCRGTVFERTSDGHVSQILWISNVTSCEHAEESRCVESFKAFFENSTDSIFLHGDEGVILELNNRSSAILRSVMSRKNP